jgi:hypothetical protein
MATMYLPRDLYHTLYALLQHGMVIGNDKTVMDMMAVGMPVHQAGPA